MNEIHISEEVQAAVQEALRFEMRKRFRRNLLILTGAVVFVPFSVWAAAIAIPNAFNDGDTLSASKLNDNFNALLTKVNEFAAQIDVKNSNVGFGTNNPQTKLDVAGVIRSDNVYQANSGFSAAFTNTESSIATVTGNFAGQPILLTAVWNQSSNAMRNSATRIRLDAIGGTSITSQACATTNGITTTCSISFLYKPTAGAHTFFLTMQNLSDGVAITTADVQFYAVELPLR